MKTLTNAKSGLATLMLALLAASQIACAQTPVDDDGKVVGTHAPSAMSSDPMDEVGNEDIPLMSDAELQELVGVIALYPDDLLAIVLPATAYPLQIVEAARFLEELENDASLKPDPEWDDSIVALLNYPEVIELLNEDMDWTWRLGEAVVAQQADVVSAIEAFRDRAYAAGNLRTDEYQTVARNDGHIEITPASEDVIYVPYYEPKRVVVYQPRPVYYYYPRSYPVYYYPYSSSYHFDRGYFWGVTTAFTIGWMTDSLHVYHHSYYGHPYFGHSYWDRWWYRRPSINVYNTTYVGSRNVTVNRYYRGDQWRPRHERRRPARETQPRIAESRGYQASRDERVQAQSRTQARRDERVQAQSRTQARSERQREPITFRDRNTTRRQEIGKAGRESVRHVQPQRRDATEARGQAQRQPDRSIRAQRADNALNRGSQRREPGAVQRQERPKPVFRSRAQRQERREPVAQQRTERREPVVRQQRPAPQRQSQRQVRAEPKRQSQRQVRAEPKRAEPKRAEPKRAEPKRAEPKRAESRRSESRSKSSGRKERRSER